jgi:hypothetical protein
VKRGGADDSDGLEIMVEIDDCNARAARSRYPESSP